MTLGADVVLLLLELALACANFETRTGLEEDDLLESPGMLGRSKDTTSLSGLI